MPGGALMAARQALGQYLIYARPWRRGLIAGGIVAGSALLLAGRDRDGHVVPTVIGALVLLGPAARGPWTGPEPGRGAE
jgi:hypothetical protein